MIRMKKTRKNQKSLWEVVKFAVVGVLNTLVDMGVFAVLNTLLGVNILVAQFFAYTAGIVNSYLFNSNWTFKGSKTKSEVIRFVVLNLLTLLISMMSIKYFEGLIQIDALFGIPFTAKMNAFVAKICTVVFTLIINFIGSKFWVFKKAGGRG